MDSRKNPYWYKLIKLLKAQKVITTGLTMPYVFGSYELLGQSFLDLNELIKHVLECDIDKYPVIQKCVEIKHDVLMVEEKQVCNKWIKEIRFESSSRKNKLFISTTTNLGSTIESICSKLNNLYGTQIKNKTYSWDNKEKQWVKFTKDEEERILSIK
jgi:hypothetical protein